MIKTMLCAAALTLSMFAATATAAPATQTRIEVSGGSYGFMYSAQCYPTITKRCPSTCITTWRTYYPGRPASQMSPSWCWNKADTSKQSSSSGVFSQGKFRSK